MLLVQCLRFAWRTFSLHAGAFLLASLVLTLTRLLLHALLVLSLKEVGSLVSQVLWALFWGGYLGLACQAAQGRRPSIADGLSPLLHHPGGLLVVGLAIVCGVFIGGVGVVVSSTLFVFAPLCVTNGASIKLALARSKDLALSNLGHALGLCLLLLALNVLGALTFAVGILVTLPVSALALVKAHDLLSTRCAVTPTA